MSAWTNPEWYAHPGHAITVAWVVWGLSWLIAAAWSRQTTQRASFADEAPYRIVTVVGALLVFNFIHIAPLEIGWDSNPALSWAMAAVVVAGFLFCWWARLTLGTLWSGTVTRKADHVIVDRGPYALVRHPIYTGLLVAAFATAVEGGTLERLLGAFLMLLGCWMKARVEERFLSQTLGPEYAAYRQRVHMLVPYLL